MASIGVTEKRAGFTFTVKLHGRNVGGMDFNSMQFRNFVKAIINKYTRTPNSYSGNYNDICYAIADEVIETYKSEYVLWAECSIETDSGYLYTEAAERVSSYV
jgi:hypothetical protein